MMMFTVDLTGKGFKHIKKTGFHDDAEVGTILEQSYPAGEEVIPDETELEFKVSIGPALIEIRDLSGYNATGVQEYADSVGLIADVVSQKQYSDTVDKGLVISQHPVAGINVKKGLKITVAISKGPEEIPPKTVTK